MTLPNLISFSGYTDSGKDVAADILVSRARFVKTHISKPLEQALVQINPWIVDRKENAIERFEDLYNNFGDRAIKDYEECRRLIRVLENEIGRHDGGNLWTDLIFEEVGTLLGFGRKVALSGVQTPEELNLVRELDGVCVWIERPVKVRAGSGVSAEDCDVVIQNDGSIKDLYVKIVVAVEEFTSNKEQNNVG